MTYVLGVSGLYHDSAAALTCGSEIRAAVQEERFTRKRHDSRFPERAIEYCLSVLDGDTLDAVAFYEDPVLSFDRIFKNMIEMAPATERIWPSAVRSQFSSKFLIADQLRSILPADQTDSCYFVDHHISHAASAFYPSPFQDAAILIVDGVGEWASTTIAAGSGSAIHALEQIEYPHSLGLLYSAFTYYCGFKVNSGEYKLMGLAPYGNPVFANRIRDTLIDLRPDGSFRLNTDFFGYLDSFIATNDNFAELFGFPRRQPESELSQAHMDLAASVQTVLEEAVVGLAKAALRATERNRLCMAGGVAFNCVANGKLAKQIAGLEDLWIQPASGDAGGAVGAALHVAHSRFGSPRHAGVGTGMDGQKGSFLGPGYRASELAAALDSFSMSSVLIDDDAELNNLIATELAAGKIVGRFDGAMEFGPRALGNRSILADPRSDDGQARINLKVKFRESWRPFAAVVLEEFVELYFDLDLVSPYMLLVAELKKEHRLPVDWSTFRSGASDMFEVLGQRRSTLPSVTHVDYSTRVQTVDHTRNPRLHALMKAFHSQTGCPILVNTSFNVRGEPIVCTPEDAIRCFLNTGLDILVLDNYVAYKSEQSGSLRALEGSISYEPD